MRQSCTSCLVQRRRESHYHGMEIARRLLRGGRREQEEQKANSAACCGCPHHRGLSAAYAGSSAVQHGRRGKATARSQASRTRYVRTYAGAASQQGPSSQLPESDFPTFNNGGFYFCVFPLLGPEFPAGPDSAASPAGKSCGRNWCSTQRVEHYLLIKAATRRATQGTCQSQT
jgi:hypothetical protein